MTWETEVVTFQEGGLNKQVHQLFGQTKVTNLVLKNGFTTSFDLWNWRQTVVDRAGNARRNGSIMLIDDGGKPLAQWNFERGWPCKWDGPPFSSSSSQLAIETLDGRQFVEQLRPTQAYFVIPPPPPLAELALAAGRLGAERILRRPEIALLISSRVGAGRSVSSATEVMMKPGVQ